MVADSGNNKIRSVTASGSVATVGSGPDAALASPSGLAARDAAPGETYVADTENHLIKKISTAGAVSIIAGSGTAGFGDGPALDASFNAPRGVAVDAAGNLYVADTGNHAVRFIDMAGGGGVATLAGQPGAPGAADGDALGGAMFREPGHVLVDGEGDVYVADTGNHRVRVIVSDSLQPSGLLVKTLAGGGTPGFADGGGAHALFSGPSAISLSDEGDIYVADAGNGALRRIANDDAATVSTIMLNGPLNPLPEPAPRPSEEAGGGGGAPSLWLPAGLAVMCALRVRRRT
jgi:sugar lactone lactonase YvrE